MRRHARSSVSCTRSSASSNEPEHPVAVHVELAPVLLGPGGELGFRGHGEHHPATRPHVALTMPEVIAPARSEARNAAVSAISSSVGTRPSIERSPTIR